jgi:hypothetical protein
VGGEIGKDIDYIGLAMTFGYLLWNLEMCGLMGLNYEQVHRVGPPEATSVLM